MSNPETDTGISVIPIESMAEVLGTFNTEAYCAVYSALPDTTTRISDVTADLRLRGAFDLTSKKRFNVNALLNGIGMPYLSVISEPEEAQPFESTNWVLRDPEAIGQFALGLSGALLQFSVDTGVPIRTVLGEEKKPTESSPHSVASRLGMLATMRNFDAMGIPFATIDIFKKLEAAGIPYGVVKTNMKKMRASGLIDSEGEGTSRMHTLAEANANRSSTREAIDYLCTTVAHFAVGTESVIESGIANGRRILSNPGVLSRLILRSYDSTSHTGKTR